MPTYRFFYFTFVAVMQYRKQYQQQRPKKNTLVISPTQVLEAIQAGTALDKVYIDQHLSEKNFTDIIIAAQQHNIPVLKVPVEKINRFNIEPQEHQGCVAVLSKIVYQDVQQVIDHTVSNGIVPLLLILDGITDVRNIGAIARSAYALGVQAIIIPEKGVGALNQDAILTSAGALEKIAICRVKSLMKTVDDLHLNGIQVYASEMTATATIHQVDFTQPCAIVLGSEDNGIYPALLKICDATFAIPMQNQFESLNVSVATGIILYEASRQMQLSK